MVAEIAKYNHIPLYIVSDSLKYTKKSVKLEQRNPKEIWKTNINIKNPAFELINKNNISGIISELGILSYNKFLKKINRN
jgi:translation initiation factor 2B subunit (eIF-2B alpha/beta/delta family)